MKMLRVFALALAFSGLTSKPLLAGAISDRLSTFDLAGASLTPITLSTGEHVIRWDATGIGALYHRYTFSLTSTGPSLGTILRWNTPDLAGAGKVCTEVCYGVIKDGQLDDNTFVPTACTPVTSITVPAQDVDKFDNYSAATVIPLDVNSLACATTACQGAELVVLVVVSNLCVGATANTIDFKSITICDSGTPCLP